MSQSHNHSPKQPTRLWAVQPVEPEGGAAHSTRETNSMTASVTPNASPLLTPSTIMQLIYLAHTYIRM